MERLSDKNKKYKVIIGLEIHVELKTKQKMFCRCDADYFGKKPNTNVCPVCLGMPGALPYPNRKAIEWTILIGKALGCKINDEFHFDRKHYFYPDLPKGYQISQYSQPIAEKGFLQPLLSKKGFRITRVHLEEDTGKLIHNNNETFVDFNRAGVPLVEIVTEPDFESAEEVKQFAHDLRNIIRYLGVSDADMEKGSMRLEPNISVKRIDGRDDGKLPPYKVELKNINSFRFAFKAIEYEIKRQKKILEEGNIPLQETRGFDEKRGVTFSQRVKENADDYRYFPEPDIPPFKFRKDEIDAILNRMPLLPRDTFSFLIKKGLKKKAAFIIMEEKESYLFFKEVLKKAKDQGLDISPQQLANLFINKKVVASSPTEFVREAKKLFKPISTDLKLLGKAIDEVLKENKQAVLDFKKGKENAIMFMVGQVMKKMQGKAKPQDVITRLKGKLKSS